MPDALGAALSRSLFFLVFSLHFHVTLGWIQTSECVGQKASRASINFCCHGGTNVFHSHLSRTGPAKDAPGFIFLSISSLPMGPSGPCPLGRDHTCWCPHPGVGPHPRMGPSPVLLCSFLSSPLGFCPLWPQGLMQPAPLGVPGGCAGRALLGPAQRPPRLQLRL